ncbi:MAG: enoyl-CoA hydratase/isomerase family protein [Salinigranum sp.]
MATDTVSLAWDDAVATLTVDRPDRLNALDAETLRGIADALEEAREDARALVITGAGEKSFVAGADIAAMREMSTQEAQEYSSLGHSVCSAVETFPAPTIAAVNGYAFGGGCELAMACDLRIASERAVIGLPEIDLGIVPGFGGTQRLPALVGDEVARRLIFFGERLDASDAHEYGLVGEVVAHDRLAEEAAEMAADLAEKPRFALAAAKELVNASHEAPREAALAMERRTMSGLFGTHDQREGMDAFLEDRDPEFE